MEIGKVVDLRGVVPGGVGWEAARAAVTASMVAHGCVVVAHDKPSADLRRVLFSRVSEIFALPLEVKQRTIKGEFHGYIGQRPGMAWESLRVEKPTDAASIRAFADILWPEGNPEFCETVLSFAKDVLKLEEMVETLVLEGLGARRESIAAHFDMLDHNMRVSHYGVPLDKQNSVSLGVHCDSIMVSGIVQHEVEGLEVHAGDGRWVVIPPQPDTFTFIAGEQFRVLTNGRVPACIHRIRTPSNRERISVLFPHRQKQGITVRVLEDLVDAEHPPLFNPLYHEEYCMWRISEEGLKFGDPLKAYCGVDKVVGAMA